MHSKMAGSIGVQSGDALTRDGEPDTVGIFKSPTGRRADAVIEHADFETVRQTRSRNDDRSAGGAAGNTMTDSIFHQRLHDKRRYSGAFYFRRDTHIDF